MRCDFRLHFSRHRKFNFIANDTASEVMYYFVSSSLSKQIHGNLKSAFDIRFFRYNESSKSMQRIFLFGFDIASAERTCIKHKSSPANPWPEPFTTKSTKILLSAFDWTQVYSSLRTSMIPTSKTHNISFVYFRSASQVQLFFYIVASPSCALVVHTRTNNTIGFAAVHDASAFTCVHFTRFLSFALTLYALCVVHADHRLYRLIVFIIVFCFVFEQKKITRLYSTFRHNYVLEYTWFNMPAQTREHDELKWKTIATF